MRPKKLKIKTQILLRKQRKKPIKQTKKINQQKKLQKIIWGIWRRRTKKKKQK